MDRLKARNIALSLATLALVGYLVWPGEIDSGWPEERFTSEKWKGQPENRRYAFAKDLIGSRVLVGKAAADVEQLLGTPTSRSPDGSYWWYIVQNRESGVSGFAVVVMINVHFDASGKVDRIDLSSD